MSLGFCGIASRRRVAWQFATMALAAAGTQRFDVLGKFKHKRRIKEQQKKAHTTHPTSINTAVGFVRGGGPGIEPGSVASKACTDVAFTLDGRQRRSAIQIPAVDFITAALRGPLKKRSNFLIFADPLQGRL